MRSQELRMREKLRHLLLDDVSYAENNENAIKSLSYQLNRSWKGVFLSGGPFDRVKKWLRAIGLDKIARKIFYK